MKNETESQLEIRKLIDAMTYVRTWLMLYHQNAMQIAQEKGIWKYYLQPNDNAPEDTKVIACSVIHELFGLDMMSSIKLKTRFSFDNFI